MEKHNINNKSVVQSTLFYNLEWKGIEMHFLKPSLFTLFMVFERDTCLFLMSNEPQMSYRSECFWGRFFVKVILIMLETYCTYFICNYARDMLHIHQSIIMLETCYTSFHNYAGDMLHTHHSIIMLEACYTFHNYGGDMLHIHHSIIMLEHITHSPSIIMLETLHMLDP